MEPISGIASFISIADALHKIYRGLRRYRKALKSASVGAKKLVQDIYNFEALLRIVENALTDLPGDARRSAEYVRAEQSQTAAAKDLIRELQEMSNDFPELLKIEQGNAFHRWLMKHRWISMQQNVQKLQFSLESSKSSISILLHVVQIKCYKEALQKLLLTNMAGKEEIARLEGKIEFCEKQIRSGRKETNRVYAEYMEYMKYQVGRPVLISPTMRAGQEAADLARKKLVSIPSSPSSGLHSKFSPRSPSPTEMRSSTPPYDMMGVAGRGNDSAEVIIEIGDDSSTDEEIAPKTPPAHSEVSKPDIIWMEIGSTLSLADSGNRRASKLGKLQLAEDSAPKDPPSRHPKASKFVTVNAVVQSVPDAAEENSIHKAPSALRKRPPIPPAVDYTKGTTEKDGEIAGHKRQDLRQVWSPLKVKKRPPSIDS